jgi:hypothetical protein
MVENPPAKPKSCCVRSNTLSTRMVENPSSVEGCVELSLGFTSSETGIVFV